MSERTRGNWSIRDELPGYGIVIHAVDEKFNCKTVATVTDAYDDQKANARLIAAAPDILEALEQMLRTPEPFYRPNAGNYAQKQAEYEAVLERARAAIAKAKGE
jgi:hypothetical protein